MTLLSGLHDDILLESLAFLTPKKLAQKRTISQKYEQLIDNNSLWNRFLKPEFRQAANQFDGKARHIFIKHPACRLSPYIDIDKNGCEWLDEQRNRLSRTQGHINKNWQVARLAQLIVSSKITLKEANKLSLNQIHYIIKVIPLIIANKLTIDEAKNLDYQQSCSLEATTQLILVGKLTVHKQNS
jgi:hypothetical protein